MTVGLNQAGIVLQPIIEIEVLLSIELLVLSGCDIPPGTKEIHFI